MIILGLGTNLGDRNANLDLAIAQIEQNLLENLQQSARYEFPPLLPENAPASWNINFLNMCLLGNLKKPISPVEFLDEVKKIEQKLGRKLAERWAPREIDIDILAWGDEIIDLPNLQIPHEAMLEREFVMLPLAEIAPNWQHPKRC